MKKSDKYNASGCLDLTAYNALKNIEHEDTEKQKFKNKRKKRKKKCMEDDYLHAKKSDK